MDPAVLFLRRSGLSTYSCFKSPDPGQPSAKIKGLSGDAGARVKLQRNR